MFGEHEVAGSNPVTETKQCPVSSAVERFVDIEEVSGSTPLSDTKIIESCQSGLLAHLGKVMVV